MTTNAFQATFTFISSPYVRLGLGLKNGEAKLRAKHKV